MTTSETGADVAMAKKFLYIIAERQSKYLSIIKPSSHCLDSQKPLYHRGSSVTAAEMLTGRTKNIDLQKRKPKLELTI